MKSPLDPDWPTPDFDIQPYYYNVIVDRCVPIVWYILFWPQNVIVSVKISTFALFPLRVYF